MTAWAVSRRRRKLQQQRQSRTQLMGMMTARTIIMDTIPTMPVRMMPENMIPAISVRTKNMNMIPAIPGRTMICLMSRQLREQRTMTTRHYIPLMKNRSSMSSRSRVSLRSL